MAGLVDYGVDSEDDTIRGNSPVTNFFFWNETQQDIPNNLILL